MSKLNPQTMTDQDWVEWFKEQILNGNMKFGCTVEPHGEYFVWQLDCDPGQEEIETAAYEWVEGKDEFFDELFVLAEQIHQVRKKTLEKFDAFLAARQKPPRGHMVEVSIQDGSPFLKKE